MVGGWLVELGAALVPGGGSVIGLGWKEGEGSHQ